MFLTFALRRSDAEGSELWGGDHVELRLSDASGEVSFDCASGHIAEHLIQNSLGRFSVQGTYTPQHSGPTRDDVDLTVPATYEGTIQSDRMVLTVIVGRRRETIGSYTLVKGQSGSVHACR